MLKKFFINSKQSISTLFIAFKKKSFLYLICHIFHWIKKGVVHFHEQIFSAASAFTKMLEMCGHFHTRTIIPNVFHFISIRCRKGIRVIDLYLDNKINFISGSFCYSGLYLNCRFPGSYIPRPKLGGKN